MDLFSSIGQFMNGELQDFPLLSRKLTVGYFNGRLLYGGFGCYKYNYHASKILSRGQPLFDIQWQLFINLLYIFTDGIS